LSRQRALRCVYLAKNVMAAIAKRSSKTAPASTARTKRLAAPTFKNAPASPVIVNRSLGRITMTDRIGVWNALLRRAIYVTPPEFTSILNR
jgi:hypothetical protein